MIYERKSRKPNRLHNYDYSTPGAYFVTICTKPSQNYFWNTIPEDISSPEEVSLSPFGAIVATVIKQISIIYPSVSVPCYVIMPNHIHLLLQLNQAPKGQPSPRLSRIITQLKGTVTKRIGTSIWQKLYHDHVVRNQQDFDRIANYIFANPMRWKKDRFYIDI